MTTLKDANAMAMKAKSVIRKQIVKKLWDDSKDGRDFSALSIPAWASVELQNAGFALYRSNYNAISSDPFYDVWFNTDRPKSVEVAFGEYPVDMNVQIWEQYQTSVIAFIQKEITEAAERGHFSTKVDCPPWVIPLLKEMKYKVEIDAVNPNSARISWESH